LAIVSRSLLIWSSAAFASSSVVEPVARPWIFVIWVWMSARASQALDLASSELDPPHPAVTSAPETAASR
jgi:hypothetical protein